MECKIRKLADTDMKNIVSMYYRTVHSVNAKDYSSQQLEAWAPMEKKESTISKWAHSLKKNISYVAEIDSKIIGFGDITIHGYLDRLYTHQYFQKKGVASSLLKLLENKVREIGVTEVWTEASITAKSFFESHEYKLVRPQMVERNGVMLLNFIMNKNIIE